MPVIHHPERSEGRAFDTYEAGPSQMQDQERESSYQRVGALSFRVLTIYLGA